MLTGNGGNNKERTVIKSIWLAAAVVTVAWALFLGNLIWQWTH